MLNTIVVAVFVIAGVFATPVPHSELAKAPIAEDSPQKSRSFPPNRQSAEKEDNDFIVIHKALEEDQLEELQKSQRAFPPNKDSGDCGLCNDEWEGSCGRCHQKPPRRHHHRTTPIHCTPLPTSCTPKPSTSSQCTPKPTTSSHCTPKPTHPPCHKEFAISHEKVKACDAEAACEQMGMKLADLRADNWERATKAMFKGIGPNEYGWIGSWNGDYYEQAPCVALYTGQTEFGGAVNVPLSCRLRRHALCQRGIKHH